MARKLVDSHKPGERRKGARISTGAMGMKRKGQVPDSTGSEEQDLTRDEMDRASTDWSQKLFWELSLGGNWNH